MTLHCGPATNDDAAAIATVRAAAADRLTREHGRGHWSSCPTERGVLRGILTSRVLVARDRGEVVATLRLATKKPWAIDPAYFTAVGRPMYLLDMAVAPGRQGQGIGRQLLHEATSHAAAARAEAIRLDAYDAPAGAGPFYGRCGYTERGCVVYRGTPLVYYELLLTRRAAEYG